MRALYDAEAARGQLELRASDAWLATAHACAEALWPWDEAYAQWRAAEALMSDRSRRSEAVTALRRAYELAADLEAAPLLADLEVLARAARVPLAAPSTTSAESDSAMSGLTPRQREVLAHLVVGRTYAEIARALFVSEKTVSSHISTMLTKTGCANRTELAQLYHRLTGTQ